jgi:APA family basic amino acid/polyamine antiporter
MPTGAPAASVPEPHVPFEFARRLGLWDSTMVVAGSMIGSGIFIVSAEMSRQIGSPGWLLVAWLVTAALTMSGALSYGELAGMMPRAGGQYVYLRESFSPLCGFLYGWTLLLIIQTGTIAAVAVAFARFSGIFWPIIGESRYIIQPIHIGSTYALSLSTAQLLGIAVIVFLTWTNSHGLEYGRIVQNVFTSSKIAALLGLIVVTLFLGWNASAVHANFSDFWSPRGVTPIAAGLSAATAFGLFVALCVSQVGSLFSSDAWNNITFTAGEVRAPQRNIPLSLALGTFLISALYLATNLGYLVTLPLAAIQHAPSDRVATAALQAIFPGLGVRLMAATIMISTFGCINGLVLAGSRACYAVARDGLFFRRAGVLNKAQVPGFALLVQGAWAVLLILPRTYDPATHTYGNLYSNLLDYVISANLIFYILTIAAVFRLRLTRPQAERPYKAFGYPLIPALYILGTLTILIVLFIYRPATTFPGLVIVLLGIPFYLLMRRNAR